MRCYGRSIKNGNDLKRIYSPSFPLPHPVGNHLLPPPSSLEARHLFSGKYKHKKSPILGDQHILDLRDGREMYYWKQRLEKNRGPGTSLVVQWLRLRAPDSEGLGSIPARGTSSHMPPLEGPASLPPVSPEWRDACNM